ncbi:MAG: TRAP transporter large permease subunit [Deltaproteobacteria bacterium]|nr:TRAP transporter large permease subunit [Deltaproteobacteria bacterium]
MILTICISFALLLLLGMPIAIMLGVITGFTLFTHTHIPLLVMPQQLFRALDNFIMLAIPFFILAGSIMTSGTMAERLIRVISLFVGNFFGGLALAGVLGCMFFAALSGSSPATVAAIGTILIPALVKYGYDEDFSVGLITTAGSLGIVIPPSIPMILYCLVMNVSVGKLFLAGVGPGLLIGLSFCGYVYFKSRRHGWRSRQTHTKAEAISIIRQGILGLLLPIIVLGGIYAGFFTPTEAAAVSVVYALIVELFIHRSLKIRDLPRICKDAAVLSTAILFIIACAMTFIWLLASHEVPGRLADFIVAHVQSWWVFLILINLLFLVMGTFMDDVAAMLIMAPLLGTTLTRFNIDPIHFGVIMVLLIEFGFLTPPFGINLFVAMGLTNKPLMRISRSVVPFIVILLICVFIVTFIPQISLFLPNWFYK